MGSTQRATAAGHGRSRTPARGAVALPGRAQRLALSERSESKGRRGGMGENDEIRGPNDESIPKSE